MNVVGGGLCACSPTAGPQLLLVIKNNTGPDLLEEKIVDSYSKDKIELFRKEVDGKIVPIDFGIREPFTYGDEKFSFKFLHAQELNFLQTSHDTVYLKLGNGEIYELNLELKSGEEKLLINKNEAEKDKATAGKYPPIFYLTK